MFEKLGIDTMKVLEAAKKKYNFQILSLNESGTQDV